MTNELIADSSPEVTSLIGAGLSADLARKIDAAYFAAVPVTGAPSGLGGIAPTDVDAGSAWNNTDAFVSAIYSAATFGVPIKAFVAHPTDAEILAKIKQSTGIDSDDNLVDSVSNIPLLGPDPTKVGSSVISGVQLLTSPAVEVGTIWGLNERALVVIRQNVTLAISDQPKFSSDSTVVRATLRVGFSFPHESSIQRISFT